MSEQRLVDHTKTIRSKNWVTELRYNRPQDNSKREKEQTVGKTNNKIRATN